MEFIYLLKYDKLSINGANKFICAFVYWILEGYNWKTLNRFNEIYIFKYDEHIQNLYQFIQIHINEKGVFAFSMNDIHYIICDQFIDKCDLIWKIIYSMKPPI